MASIQISGFDLLNKDERNGYEKLLYSELEKFQKRRVITSFSLNLKNYNREGTRSKYSLHCRIMFDGKHIEAESFDWDFRLALHKLFHKLENQIEHMFHGK